MGEAEGGEEAQAPRVRKAPMAPSAEAVAAHRMIGHAVYRSWCRHCVQGRGHNAPHYGGRSKDADELPVFSFDYGFLGSGSKVQDEVCEREGQAPFLAFCDSASKATYAMMAPQKGIDYPVSHLAVKTVVDILDRSGYKRIAFRSDGEHPIRSFLGAVKTAWDGEVVPEKSPPGESASNGAAEKTVQTAKAVFRSVLFGLEENLGARIPADHPLMSWILVHGTSCQRRYAVGHNGKTAFENLNGRKPQNQVVEFGEKVWWRPLQPKQDKLDTMEPRLGILPGAD